MRVGSISFEAFDEETIKNRNLNPGLNACPMGGIECTTHQSFAWHLTSTVVIAKTFLLLKFNKFTMNAFKIAYVLALGLSLFVVQGVSGFDREIAWGPKTESGIRVGLSIEGGHSSFYAGAQFRPTFHFRNDSERTIDFSHPRMVQVVSTKFFITDQAGTEVGTSTLQDSLWIAGYIGGILKPKGVAEVPGSAIRIGGSDYKDASGQFQAVIHAKPGQRLKLSFQLNNFQTLIPEAKTGTVDLHVVDTEEKANQDIDELGDWISGERFQAKQYANMASLLLSLEPETRIELMRSWCKSHDTQVHTLCRMLFVSSENNQNTRAPRLGAPVFLQGTEDDWPRHPIVVCGGIPFLVVRGYDLGGEAEPARVYLNFCLSRYHWTKGSYVQFNDGSYQTGLQQLLRQRKWTTESQQFLTNQIPIKVELVK